MTQTTNKPATIGALMNAPTVQSKFEKLLGAKSQGFISSVLQTVNNSKLLANADPNTILNAAATAASLDLPINQSLGFAWIVPYKGQAQFQIGWKGLVQLALRTGQYSRINCIEVFENQFKGYNALTEELDADFSVDGNGKVVGYAAYFKLINGYEKLSYWSKEKVTAHAKKYSQSYGTKYSPWSDESQFDAMAKKTVLKNTLSKWGIMSIEMQTATIADQAIVHDNDNYQYADNTVDVEVMSEQQETERVVKFLEKVKSIDDLDVLEESLADEQLTEDAQDALLAKRYELTNAKK